MNLKNLGAGMPDGGLFTADQFRRQADEDVEAGQLPARGAIEAKGTKPNVKAIAKTPQVIGDKDRPGYLKTYGIVIITNLREFLIVERGPNGQPVEREAFALAADEHEFWQDKAAHPRATANAMGEQFAEFIRRACLHAAPLVNPKDVAWFLASYARDALCRVELQRDLPALQTVRAALEEALGMKFTAEKGEHFFRSTLVQTLFYGVFSAWVRWHKDNPSPNAKFDWRTAEWTLHVPFVRTLYEEVAKPSRLGPLRLVEVLDWAANVLNRVARTEFFTRFEDEHAVQYFYEPFLEAYDPALRKELGVWYTPREIVKYQVARVDRVLRDELGLTNGLAEPNVIVLDPCCGTGAYLVEVLNSIATTLRERGGDALVASDLKTAAMNRVFGFEILPAPFVVSHLQLGLMLQAQGAPLSASTGERIGVYLTNALTGWQPPKGPKKLLFPELEAERDAAEKVKRDKTILVVLGNPPYNAFAGVSPEEEEGLVEPYKGAYRVAAKTKKGKLIRDKDRQQKFVTRYKLNDPITMGGWGLKRNYIDDLYIRFFRIAERRIAEMSGKGIVSFISNHSWISESSYVIVRQHLLESFDKFWIENLHGNRKNSEYAPDGRTSETIFAIKGYSVGIQQGVATSLWAKTGKPHDGAKVFFRDDIDAARAQERRLQLLNSLQAESHQAAFTEAYPLPENRYAFRPESVSSAYEQWASLRELVGSDPLLGLNENRSGALYDIDRAPLEDRMRLFLDASLSWDEYVATAATLATPKARFDPRRARDKALKSQQFDIANVMRYSVRPLDTRWCYWIGVRPVWNEPRPLFRAQVFGGNAFIVTRPTGVASPEGVPFLFTRLLGEMDSIRGHSYHFPVLLSATTKSVASELFSSSGQPHANLSARARAYLAALGISAPDVDFKTSALVWMHALAIGYSPAYLTENAHGIRRDWPRIPLPRSRDALEASAALGERIAAILDTESDLPGVTGGKLGPVFKTIGLITKVGGGQIDAAGSDLAMTAGWGHAGKGGVTMPGQGKQAERNYDETELKAIDAESTARGMSAGDVQRLLGENTCDVYLNGAAYWRNIPLNVWEYFIGGYQVIKKWLSYREHVILGRTLKPEDAREVTNMARRIAAIILLQPKLDENYRAAKALADTATG
jgi:hypothetical protein